MSRRPSPPDHDCGSYTLPPRWPWQPDPRTLPGHCGTCGLPRSLDPTHDAIGEPARRFDTISEPGWLFEIVLIAMLVVLVFLGATR
jgi:hypothetical protein